jgi:hypothetical protein
VLTQDSALSGRLIGCQPLQIHPEDGNCNVFRNVGKFSTFDMDHSQKLKLYTELQQQKPKDKNTLYVTANTNILAILSWKGLIYSVLKVALPKYLVVIIRRCQKGIKHAGQQFEQLL